VIVVDGIEVSSLNYAQREELVYDVKAQMVEQRVAIKRALARANILHGAVMRMTEELHAATVHAKDCAEREEELRAQLEAMAVEFPEDHLV